MVRFSEYRFRFPKKGVYVVFSYKTLKYEFGPRTSRSDSIVIEVLKIKGFFELYPFKF